MVPEYTDIATLKLALNSTDATRDDLLSAAIRAASRGIDRNCGRRFYLDPTPSARTYIPTDRVIREDTGGLLAFGASELLIVDDIGSTDGLIVETGVAGGDFTAVTDFEVLPENALAKGLPLTGLLRTAGYWGYRTSRVRVTARWGWPQVPDEVVEATKIQALRLYRRKDSPEGILGSAEWGAVRVGRIDPDVYELTKHLVLPGF